MVTELQFPFAWLPSSFGVFSNMDACIGVEREAEKVSKKYNGIREHLHSSLDELIENISAVQRELSQGEN